MAFYTPTSQWSYRVTGLINAGLGSILGLDIYSGETGFLGHTRFYGGGISLLGGVDINLISDWGQMRSTSAWSPSDLHGASGRIVVAMMMAGVGGGVLDAIASNASSYEDLFATTVGTVGTGFDIGMGVYWGMWRITSVWSEGTPPVL